MDIYNSNKNTCTKFKSNAHEALYLSERANSLLNALMQSLIVY